MNVIALHQFAGAKIHGVSPESLASEPVKGVEIRVPAGLPLQLARAALESALAETAFALRSMAPAEDGTGWSAVVSLRGPTGTVGDAQIFQMLRALVAGPGWTGVRKLGAADVESPIQAA